MIMGTIMAGWRGWQWGPMAALIAGAFGGILGGLLLGAGDGHVRRQPHRVRLRDQHHRPRRRPLHGQPAVHRPRGGRARRIGQQRTTRRSASSRSVSLAILSSGPDLLGELEEKGWLADLRRRRHPARADVRSAASTRSSPSLLVVGTGYLRVAHPVRPAPAVRPARSRVPPTRSACRCIKMRYYGVIISGALAGMGGAVMVFAGANRYQEGQTQGQGFLGLATLVFGNWMPAGIVRRRGVFGYSQGITLRIDAEHHVLALMLAVGIALALFAVWSVYKRNTTAAVISGVVAAFALLRTCARRRDQQPVRLHDAVRRDAHRGHAVRPTTAPARGRGHPVPQGRLAVAMPAPIDAAANYAASIRAAPKVAAARPPRRWAAADDRARARRRDRLDAARRPTPVAAGVVHPRRRHQGPAAVPRHVRAHARRDADRRARSSASPPRPRSTSPTTASSTPRCGSHPSCTRRTGCRSRRSSTP